MTTITASRPLPPQPTDAAATGSIAKINMSPPNAIASAFALASVVNSQVLSNVFIPAPSLEQLEELVDNTTFTDAQMAQALSLAEQSSSKEQIESVLSFDPGAWEKHVGVLVAAIIAVNLSRQTSAQLKGSYTVMAAAAAVSQGMAIIEAGKAVMTSAITGAAVAGAMAMGGMTLSLKGQSQKHTDIKSNKQDAANHRNRATDLDVSLKKNSFVDNPTDNVKGFKAANSDGTLKDIELKASGNNLTEQERAVLKQEIVALNKKASTAELQSALNEKVFSKNLTLGQTLSSMAMVMSTMVGTVSGFRQYSERQNEVLAQSEQTIGKSLGDEAAQRSSEETSLAQKLMEVFNQINQGRNAAASAIASGIKA